MADSLFLPREVEQNLYDRLSGVEITFGGKKDEKSVVIPSMFIRMPDLFDSAISACTTVAEAHAESQKDNQTTLDKYLAVHVPDLHKLLEYEAILEELWKFTDALAELIREKKNSIWSFIIRNSYRPTMLREQFDFIIGNPPWLSYRYISDPDYQNEIKKRAVTKYKIAPKSQKLFTQMELATVFLAHSMATFAKKDGHLAFVMPRSVLSADQHRNLITRKYSPEARFQLTGYWDMWGVAPLFNVPCCVLFAKRYPLPGSSKEVLPVVEWAGNLSARDVNWEAAKGRLTHEEKKGRVIYLGSRAALSTAPGATAPSNPSDYAKVFKQGATILPRNFYFVRVTDFDGVPDPTRQYWAETDPEQAVEAKPPYDDVDMKGMVEGRFLFTTALSRHVLPFVHFPPATIVLPVTSNDGELSVIKADELIETGYREFGTWMQTTEELWNTKRGDKAGKQTIYERLDYQGELTNQSLKHRHLVLYNAAGTNVSATYFDRHDYPTFVVEHKLYWAAFSNVHEAHYVVALLNSDTANQAIKPFQSTGLMGERDIEKKLLELPFPIFDQDNKTHRRLSELGVKAREAATKALKSGTFPATTLLARQRGFIRTHVESKLKEIDDLVTELLNK